jgi:CMP-2-keto-3-deoxyoctulosonic acid synthetase
MYKIGILPGKPTIKEIRSRLREPEQLETLTVVKNGKSVDIVMDKSKNKAIVDQIQNNLKKD